MRSTNAWYLLTYLLVVNTLVSINKVALHRMGDCLYSGKPSRYVTNHPGQVSLQPLWGIVLSLTAVEAGRALVLGDM